MKRAPIATQNERVGTPFTHVFEIDYTDLNGTAGLTKTISLIDSLPVGNIVTGAAFHLPTAFDGGATSTLTVKVGWNGATVDDDDGLIEAAELHADNTEILAGDATGAAFATKRTGFAPQETTAIEALFTSVGTNLSALTTGKVRLFLAISDLTKYAP